MNGQVRVTYIKADFNKIMELTNHAMNDSKDDIVKESKKFFDKVMKYSYVKEEKVIMNLYPAEARFLINILTNNTKEVEVSNDWMIDLINKKEEFKRNKESDLNA